MKKPKWRITFRLLKMSQFNWGFKKYINQKLSWKDKYDSPRIEIIPKYLFSFFCFQLDFIQGSEEEWEWYLWVTYYCGGNLEKGIETFPWCELNSEGKLIKTNPHLKYNK